jgi:type IV secretory pathway TrbF-like protein
MPMAAALPSTSPKATDHVQATFHPLRQIPEPETPYQRAAQVWDDRIGSARVQAKNWRLMAFGSLALSAALSAGCSGSR